MTIFKRLLLLVALLLVLVPASVAAAAGGRPAWGVDSVGAPSVFSPAQNAACAAHHSDTWTAAIEVCDYYTVTVTNIGSQASSGAAVKISDVLPGGLSVELVSLLWEEVPEPGDLGEKEELPSGDCPVAAGVITCVVPGRRVVPDGTLTLMVFVSVSEGEPVLRTLTNSVTVEGGGAAQASYAGENTVGGPAPSFGLSGFAAPFVGLDGTPESQAGGHPYELPVKIDLNSTIRESPEGAVVPTSVQDLRDAVVDLPLGVSGSAVSAPRCTLHELSNVHEANGVQVSDCPPDTIVGYIHTLPEGFVSAGAPVYNVVPERGVAAEFGFLDSIRHTHVIAVSVASTPEGYVLRSTAREVPAIVLGEITTNIYGDPAVRDKSHEPAVAMFTNPTDCSGEPLITTVYMDSWQNPAKFNADGMPANLQEPAWVKDEVESSPPVTGCSELAGLFNPEIEAKPESTQTDSPTGLQVNLKVPQQTGVETLGTPPVKNTTVTLPEGFTVNPSQANGLQACSEAQIGWLGKSPDPSGELENFTPGAPECPEASKIGTVELESPDLPSEACRGEARSLSECAKEEPAESGVFPEREKTPLTGSIYVARQYENPFGSLLAIYIVVDDPRTGVIVKLPGELKLNPSTGQIATTFDDTPQFSFSELRTHFFGGDDAPLKTPSTCGSYTLSSELEPWSAPESGPAATSSSTFEIGQAAGGGACAAPGFAPSFKAETAPTAGSYTPLTVHLNREDGSQNISALNVTLPPGLTGKIAGLPQCSQAQIAAAEARDHPGEGAAELASPSCPASSEVGTVTVGAGAGPTPYYVTGHVYFAGPYNGSGPCTAGSANCAPFSLAIVTPAVAGPFDLGVVTVRAGLYVNPITAQVTTKSDPIPQWINGAGIPSDVRSITVNISHNNDFIVNPTSCDAMSITGEAISTSGQVAPLSDAFKAEGCEHLGFAPKFTVSTSGKTSKADGTSLTTKITYPGPFTSYSNIAKVKVELPKQLPSRLTTLQKACLASQFEANPAGCPAASVVGHATAITPILPVPLSGPAYFVSHGNEAFPSLTMVLQGDGITIDLVGTTFISKSGITSTTFKAVPDQPVESFELTLPQGPYSALTANGNLCTVKGGLKMPTEFTAQNGTEIHQNTKIAITGCPKVKTLTRAQKLKKALAACKKDRKKAKRQKCEKAARKKYGPIKKAKKKRGK